MPPTAKTRLDLLLVARGHFDSREKARRAILAGEIRRADGRVLDKAGLALPADAELRVEEKRRYVGRGGLKLEGALAAFGIDPAGRACLDVGASTGGFTDCLLQRGAARVFAVDVGHNQLDWKIRSDPRVDAREGVNARHLAASDFPPEAGITLAVGDVSFISLTKILPAVAAVLAPAGGAGEMCLLVKPQFELRPADVGRGGIVRDPAARRRALESVRAFVATALPGWRWAGECDSPITGTDGNHEYFCHLRARGASPPAA